MLYLPQDTWVHRLHPQAKGGGLLLYFLCVLLLSHPLWLLLPAIVLSAVVASGRLWAAFTKVAPLLGVLFVATVLMWALVYGGGEAWFELGFLSVSKSGLIFGFAMAMRLCLMVAAGIAYLAATRVEETTWSLRRSGIPYRAAFALGLSFRLLPLFLAQARRIREAQMARGLDLESGGLLRRARSHLPLIVPVLLSAMRRVDRLAVALECRGFGSDGETTSYHEYRFGPFDVLWVCGAAGLLALEVWLRWQGLGGLGMGRMPGS